MRADLQTALKMAAQEVPVDEIPEFLGALEEVRVTAVARLHATPAPAQPSDHLLDIKEAAHRLGMSREYLYRNHHKYPFTRRMGKRVRFSAKGIEDYIRGQETAKRS